MSFASVNFARSLFSFLSHFKMPKHALFSLDRYAGRSDGADAAGVGGGRAEEKEAEEEAAEEAGVTKVL